MRRARLFRKWRQSRFFGGKFKLFEQPIFVPQRDLLVDEERDDHRRQVDVSLLPRRFLQGGGRLCRKPSGFGRSNQLNSRHSLQGNGGPKSIWLEN